MFWLSKVKFPDFIQPAKQTMRGMGGEVPMLAWREEGVTSCKTQALLLYNLAQGTEMG
jgi:hypothetical protein